MWKKAIFTLAIVITAPLALVNCAASGSGSIGDDDAGASSTTGENDAHSESTSGTSSTSTTR